MSGFGIFGNPLTNGIGALIRTAIQSVNFVAGVSGWAIFKDGSYEFGSGGTIRGDVTVTGTDGSKVEISANPGTGARIDFYPPLIVGETLDIPGFVGAVEQPRGTGRYGITEVASPAVEYGGTGPVVNGILQVGSGSTDTAFPVPLLDFNGDASFDGVLLVGPNQSDIGQGISLIVSAVTSSAASGAEVIVLQATGFVFKAGRAYSIRMGGGAQTSVAGTVADFRVKKTVAGAISATTYGEFYRTPCAVSGVAIAAFAEIFVKNATGTDITADFALTLQSATNTVFQVGGAGRQRYMAITDVDAASSSDFTNATQVS